jgi:ABC-2 type transport system ATP-binding protein
MAVVIASSLRKEHSGEPLYEGVSFKVERADRLALAGPNGAGKTTLLSIIAGIQQSNEGDVSRPAGEVGWVPQQAAVYGKLTVSENLRLFARLEGCRDVEAVVARMLRQTGLEERADDQVATLSGGNRQRVNIAIGLLAQPEVLLLDEPSAALDPRQRERLWEFIRALAEAGTAVLFSTHNVAEAERNAHRVIVLADGELIFQGGTRELEAQVASNRDFETAFVEFLHKKGH